MTAEQAVTLDVSLRSITSALIWTFRSIGGSIEDGIRTCHWHHARFDLATSHPTLRRLIVAGELAHVRRNGFAINVIVKGAGGRHDGCHFHSPAFRFGGIQGEQATLTMDRRFQERAFDEGSLAESNAKVRGDPIPETQQWMGNDPRKLIVESKSATKSRPSASCA